MYFTMSFNCGRAAEGAASVARRVRETWVVSVYRMVRIDVKSFLRTASEGSKSDEVWGVSA